MDKQSKFGILASAILDGTPIDWRALDATDGAEDQAVIQQLKVIAEIAAVHRSPEPTEFGRAGPAPVRDDVTGQPARWGHLRLLERVGAGTFGDVYRAWDTNLEREVALKLLRTRETSDDPLASVSDPARVVNEGRLLARVRHANVITVYGAEPRDGSVGIWMEFIRGRTLHHIVQQQGPMGARETAGIGTELCRALAAVHGAGLLHRDVTARNVMREDGGRVVLMDFGAGHEHQDGSVRAGLDVTGTPLYMAPELFSGGHADQRTDIYALGVLLFHLATGRFPVTGGSIRELGNAHAQGARTRLRDVRADLPVPLVRAVEAATAPNPADRFRTIGDFEAALEHGVIGERTSTRRWAQPTWQLIAAAAAVAAGSAILVSALWIRRPEPASPSGNSATAARATTELTTRRLVAPRAVFPFTNPSDDGRYVAGMLNENGDAAIVDLATGDYRALRVGRGDGTDGYASLGALSRDGRLVAIDWYQGRDASLRIVGTDGTGARVLIDPPGDVRAYEWSRDGTMVLAALGRENGAVLALVAARDGGVRVLCELGHATPRHASFSDDGRYVVYDHPQSEAATDHDLFIVDTHTLDRWPLDLSPGHDVEPFWTHDGSAVVFLSDRNRNPSLWSVAIANGRQTAAPRLVKDDVGRVVLRGVTRNGTLHYQLNAGFAEVYVASLESSAAKPQPISPRQALSNFYPVWSREGRYLAYTSERSINGRELWVFDTESGRESRVPAGMPLGRPYGWSRDSRSLLVSGPDDGRLYTIERATGQVEAVASGLERAAAWGPAGVVYQTGRRVVVYDPQSRRTLRAIDYSDPAIVDVGRPPVLDGRSLIAQHENGGLALHDTATGQSWTWHDSGIQSLREHIMAPHTRAVAYAANRKDLRGEASTLMLWSGSGEPREVLRVHSPENFRLVGWTPDGLNLLIVRWSFDSAAGRRVGNETLWRVPITGSAPFSTGLALDGLRDVSIHPNGGQIAFNAGWKRVEHWVMENVLSNP